MSTIGKSVGRGKWAPLPSRSVGIDYLDQWVYLIMKVNHSYRYDILIYTQLANKHNDWIISLTPSAIIITNIRYKSW